MGKVVEKERVGEKLPEGWKWIRLGDHVTKIGSGITPRGGYATYLKSGIPLIRSQNVHMNRFDYEGLAHISKEQDDAMKPSRVLAGDVLLNITGASIGRVCIVPSSLCPANVNQHVTIIRSNGSFESQFLSYYISNPEFQKYILDAEAGATRQALTKTLIEDFKIPLPPLPEQKRIVGILSDRLSAVEQARAATAAQLAAAKALPAAYLRQVFDSPEAQTWKRKSLRDLCRENGQYGTSEQSNTSNRGLPVLRMGNIFEGELYWNNLKFSQLAELEEKKYLLEEGDIIFNRTNSAELVGKTAVFDGFRDAIFASYLIRFRAAKEIADPHFISAYINSHLGRAFIEANMGRAIGQVNISASVMHTMPIPTPPVGKQREISLKLRHLKGQVKSLQQSLQSQLDTINQLPAALLRQAFNGEL